MNVIKYYLDGIDFHQYGVFVSASDGLTSQPKMKSPMSLNWDNYHGEMVDLRKKYYESRIIKLECFVKASGPVDFISKVNAFQELFAKPWTRRLSVVLDGNEPLLYEVYCEDGIEMKSRWSKDTMVGTFTLTLKEPEPVKRVYKFNRQSAGDILTMTITSNKMVNIYWGDGSHTFDTYGTLVELGHSYTENGTYYIVVTGDIDEIGTGDIDTNATLVWNKL